MKINIDNFDLIIFGDFRVLTNTPFEDNVPLHMLPGRVEFCAWLQEDRKQRLGTPLQFAVVGNKGGVAWAAQTEGEAEAEVKWTADQIGSPYYRVCFGCPRTKAGYERYAAPEHLKRRKPAPDMFQELIAELRVEPARVLIVDHYADGYNAAGIIGCTWYGSAAFFALASRSSTVPSSGDQEDLEAPDDIEPFTLLGGIL